MIPGMQSARGTRPQYPPQYSHSCLFDHRCSRPAPLPQEIS